MIAATACVQIAQTLELSTWGSSRSSLGALARAMDGVTGDYAGRVTGNKPW